MTWESWFKVGLPAIPVGYTILGVWLYWGENPLPLLAPSIAFWGVVVNFYLFTHVYLPQKRSPFFLAIFTANLWLVASITAHNLGRFFAAGKFVGIHSLFCNKDFWYSYLFGTVGFAVALWQFVRHEPLIVAQIKRDREEIQP